MHYQEVNVILFSAKIVLYVFPSDPRNVEIVFRPRIDFC